MTKMLVVAGGDPVSVARMMNVGLPDQVIAADSGAELAVDLGIAVDLLVGDLDSIGSHTLEQLETQGVAIERHPADKDKTDLQLALDAAVERGATTITVVGGAGGRLDHFRGNVGVVCSPTYADVSVSWVTEDATSYVVHTHRTILTTPGTTLSVVAVGASASGVSVSGTKWPLDNAQLESGSSLGISNIAISEKILVSVQSGRLLVIESDQRS